MSSLLPFLLMFWFLAHFLFPTLIGNVISIATKYIQHTFVHRQNKVIHIKGLDFYWYLMLTNCRKVSFGNVFCTSASYKGCVLVWASCYLPNVIVKGNWLSHICHFCFMIIKILLLLKVFNCAAVTDYHLPPTWCF